MGHNPEHQQLAVINELMSLISAKNINCEIVSQSIKALPQLLNTEWLLFTLVYKDINNKQYHLNHFSLASSSQQPSPSQVDFSEENILEFVNTLYQKQDQVVCAKADLIEGFINPNDVPASRQDKYQCVPFFEENTLVGTLTFPIQNELKLAIEYPTLFKTLQLVFSQQTNRKNAELINDTYQTVLDLMPQRVFWKNRQSVYLGCNKAFSDDASLPSPRDIIGVTDYDIFPEQAELYRSDDNNTMTTLEHLIASEEPQTHQNGNTIWLRTSKRPVINSDERVVGVVGTYDDITALKEIQNELEVAKNALEVRVEQRTQELSQANGKLEQTILELQTTQQQLIEQEKMASLGGLVAGIAHEINTPLGIAVTSASNLETVANELKRAVETGSLTRKQFEIKCDELISSCDLILRNIERASELILNFKGVAADQVHEESRTFKLHKYLSEVINTLSPRTSKKNIKILLSGDEEFQIDTYPGVISQITTNIVDNAFVHAFPDIYDGTIHIAFKMVNKKRIQISFQDNGIGMDADTVRNIFEPFYTTKRGQGGTGLGLSIVYNLITQTLKGTIRCDSEVGEMSRFTIELPI